MPKLNGVSVEYQEAFDQAGIDSRIWEDAKRAYRSKEIDDDTFFAAVAAWRASCRAFDAAITKEEGGDSR